MRSYAQFCGVAKALDVVGSRWTLLLIRDLLPGPRRYGDLLDSHPGLTTNLLADRLKHLVAHGLIEKVQLPPPAGSMVYQLTEAGLALEPAILALGSFGERYLAHGPQGERRDLRWFAVSMRRRFQGSGPPFRVQLDGPRPIHVHWDGERLHTRDGEGPADVRIQGAFLPMVLLGRRPVDSISVEGDRTVLERLMRGLSATHAPGG